MSAPTINIDEIIAEFGAKYVQGSQGLQNLQTRIWQKSETDQLFGLWPTEDTVAYKATSSITRVLQSYQSGFTPIGDTKFELQPIPLYHVKIDEQITPQDLMPSWLGFLADGSLDPTQWGIVRYWLEELIVNKYKEDLELNEAFKGVFAAPTAGTPGASGTALNGIRKTIRDGHTASKTSMIAMGAVPTDPIDFVEYVESFILQIPELHRNLLDNLVMNKTLQGRFKQGMRSKYNLQYNQVSDLLTVIDTNIKVSGVASQAGSDMLWTTMKANKANPQKWSKNQGIFDIQKQDRNVKALSDWWIGYGFWYLPYVYHTDQDLS